MVSRSRLSGLVIPPQKMDNANPMAPTVGSIMSTWISLLKVLSSVVNGAAHERPAEKYAIYGWVARTWKIGICRH